MDPPETPVEPLADLRTFPPKGARIPLPFDELIGEECDPSFSLGRIVNMFLSKGEFDPRLELEATQEDVREILQRRERDIKSLNRQAEEARIAASRAARTTYELAERIRQIRDA
jgi:hypothetical protein